jgi:hypothetical protein
MERIDFSPAALRKDLASASSAPTGSRKSGAYLSRPKARCAAIVLTFRS